MGGRGNRERKGVGVSRLERIVGRSVLGRLKVLALFTLRLGSLNVTGEGIVDALEGLREVPAVVGDRVHEDTPAAGEVSDGNDNVPEHVEQDFKAKN
jgi:hypothetical protein